MRTVSGLYDNYDDAQDAVGELEASGIPSSDISIVANNSEDWYESDEPSEAAEDAGTGAGIGAVVGGAGGLLTGLGVMAIPGVGPGVAAGWLAATAVGAVAGAAVGGATVARAGVVVGVAAPQAVSRTATKHPMRNRRRMALTSVPVEKEITHLFYNAAGTMVPRRVM